MSNTILKTLQETKDLFLPAIPQIPQGRYVHFILMRETESFPLFQTDGTLNIIRVQAGLTHGETISRLVMFKRKQTSPERLRGRELLRYFGLITDSGERACEYNSANFCKQCPDCILYGYAIGNEGAEKSKVYADSAFSITSYEESHKALSFNALYEHGTMTQAGTTRSSFGEQDHVVPQVFFPAVIALRDPTYESFLYVLGNILHTSRYGAQDSRTGAVYNHLVATVFANGEIFSNLRFTQAIYDHLRDEQQEGKESNSWQTPLSRDKVLGGAATAFNILMQTEPVFVARAVEGKEVEHLRQEVTGFYQKEAESNKFLSNLYEATSSYAGKYGARRTGK
ncbi:MAG: type I-D CRISPR-associated protein Cas7/Csc2 [Anaerolineae bacterium]|nr:type I-D CRISPR-associated protein Cas7/Csc2 [Anaerolineae bacterium]